MAAFSSNIDITSGGTYAMDVTNGETSAKVATDLNGKFANIQELLQNGLPEVWTGDSLPDSLPSGKIIFWNGVMYSGDASGNLSGINGFSLKITFTSNLAGQTFTVKAGGQTITGTVPSGLYSEVTVQELNTQCTITCTGITGTMSFMLPEYYGYKEITFGINNVLNDTEWSFIKVASDSNQGANYWKVGDYKEINLNGTVGILEVTGIYRAFILGFNHNSSREGNNRIHFMIGKNQSGQSIAFADEQYNQTGSSMAFRMDTNNINSGGWRNSYMRNTILGSSSTASTVGRFMAVIPSDLRTVLKSCKKYTDNTGSMSNSQGDVTATTDYMWLCSEFEVQGVRSRANQYEQNYQKQYQYFKAGNLKVKYGVGPQTGSVIWWLRSPSYNYSSRFCTVTTNGTASSNSAYHSFGVSPCFCV